MQTDSLFHIGPDVGVYAFSDEFVLIDYQSDTMYTLNQTGVRIWELLKAGHSQRSICHRLSQEFPTEQAQLSAEVEEFLASLLRAGLISLS